MALPEIFTGDGKQSWSDWVDHFGSVAVVNGWTADDKKKKWIRVRITGRAATAYKQLSANDQSTYYRSSKKEIRVSVPQGAIYRRVPSKEEEED